MAPELHRKLFRRLAEANTDSRFTTRFVQTFPAPARTMRKGRLYSSAGRRRKPATNVLKSMRKMTTECATSSSSVVHLLRHQLQYNILMRFPGRDGETTVCNGAGARSRTCNRVGYCQGARRSRIANVYRTRTQSIRKLKPAACYDYIFPKRFNLERCRIISHEMDNGSTKSTDDLLINVASGKTVGPTQAIRSFDTGRRFPSLVIEDGRRRKWHTHSYEGGPAKLYEYCCDAVLA